MFFTLPNLISFSRIPLAFLFLQDNLAWRLAAVILALVSDGLDGYIARRQACVNKFGIFLDPIADKFFVVFTASILITEGQLHPFQAVALVCRDIFVLLFGSYLFFDQRLAKYQFRSIQCGKITTTLQFLVLMTLSLGIVIPSPIYVIFVLLGLLSFVELALSKQETRAPP